MIIFNFYKIKITMTEELCHIRCLECGKVLANKWNTYKSLLEKGVSINDALTQIGLDRYCCRVRMMNPFKIPTRSARQFDPRDTGLMDQMENLSMATGPTPVLDPLEDMINNNMAASRNVPSRSGYTVVPLNPEHVNLPSIPQVALPPIPTPGVDVAPEKPRNVIRSYQAW